MNDRYKVMVVDDNPSLCQLVSETLQDDYEIFQVYSGEAALEQLAEINPQVVLLDIMMPGIDGFEVCRRIRADDRFAGIKVVFLSARSTIEDRLSGYEVQGDDFLAKPFDCEELKAKVDVYFRLITEEQKRKEAEEKYRSLVENSPDIIVHANRRGEILFSNQDFLQSDAEDHPKNLFEFVPRRSRELVKSKIDEVFETGSITSFETRHLDFAGNRVWFSTRVGPIVKSGQIDGITLFSREITEQKFIEEELRNHKLNLERLVEERTSDLMKSNELLREEIREKNQAKDRLQASEEKYRSILESIEEGYYELDLEGRLTFLNRSLATILGSTADRLLKQPLMALPGMEKARILRKTLEVVKSTGHSSPVVKWELNQADGGCKYLETSVSLIKEASEPVGYRGIIRDISERHAHEVTMEGLFKHAVGTLARAAEVFDRDTGDHTVRIGDYSRQLAHLCGMNEQYQKDIRISAQLHDVGKIHITSAMLNKAGALTDQEFEVIKNHTLYGSIIIGKNPDFKMANEIALFHHEKWNGTGYPDRLRGRAIPLAARITAIVDVFDALVSKRAYKKAFSYEAAKSIMTEGDRRLNPRESFDPNLRELFLDHFETFTAIHHKSLEVEQSFAAQKLNIVLLEDDAGMAEMIQQHIEDLLPYAQVFGYATNEAIREGLIRTPEFYPHVCFIDVNLPDGSGHEAAEKLKERFPDSHLICITADDDIDITKVNLYGHRVFRKNPQQMEEFLDNLVKTAEIIREYHYNPLKNL